MQQFLNFNVQRSKFDVQSSKFDVQSSKTRLWNFATRCTAPATVAFLLQKNQFD